jgi:hypothetical protein
MSAGLHPKEGYVGGWAKISNKRSTKYKKERSVTQGTDLSISLISSIVLFTQI